MIANQPSARRLALVVSGAILVASASAQQPRNQRGPVTTELPQSPVRLPLDISSKHPVVSIMLNDSGPFRFVLDTAAGLSLIDEPLAKQLALSVVGQARVGDATADGARTADLVRWDTIQLGDLTLREGIAVSADLSAVYMGEEGRPDGILGFGLFQECLLTLDYPNSVVIIEKAELPPADDVEILDFRLTPSIPEIEAQLAGRPVRLVIDSGAATGLVVTESSASDFPTHAPPKPVRYAGRLNTVMEVTAARIAGNLSFGRHTLTTPIADFSGIRALIGHDVLHHFAVSFDQKNKRVRFARKSPDAIPPKPCYAAGLRAIREGDARVIERIIPGSPAADAGLRIGDRITAVNGQPSADVKLSAWRKLLDSPGEAKLSVDRDGKTEHLTLRVRAVID